MCTFEYITTLISTLLSLDADLFSLIKNFSVWILTYLPSSFSSDFSGTTGEDTPYIIQNLQSKPSSC